LLFGASREILIMPSKQEERKRRIYVGYERKLIKWGPRSCGVVVPRELLDEWELEPGDKVIFLIIGKGE